MIQVKYWKSIKVPTVAYGSQDVSMTLTTECPPEKFEETYEELKEKVNSKVESEAKRIESISKKDISHLRIREKMGIKYPSVTSIINPDPYTNNPSYGIRGTEYHRLFNHWIKTGEVLSPDTTLNIRPLGWDLDFAGFIKVYGAVIPRKDVELEKEVYNEKWMYSGEIDYLGATLADVKTGGWKLEQLCAYNESLEKPRDIVQIFDLKKKEIKEFKRTDDKYQEAWLNFIYLRGEFAERFSI